MNETESNTAAPGQGGLQVTPLHEVHRAAGARMTAFGGWDMPLSYQDILSEHLTVRRAAGLFDLGHMGRFRLDGPDRVALLERVSSNRVANMSPGEARYAVLTSERGFAIDDIIMYAFDDHFLVVVNASNRDKDFAWLMAHADGLDAGLSDVSASITMVALQGPNAELILGPLTEGCDLAGMGYYEAAYGAVRGVPTLLTRTGYTGEDGFELYFPADAAVEQWAALLAAGASSGLIPAGLGARDTLRLEAAMPLYGHELTSEVSPFEAGLGFAVKLKGRSFVGRDALAAQKKAGLARKLCCLVGDGRRIPREGYAVMDGSDVVGAVTSGSFSPTLQKPIALALVRPSVVEIGRALTIDVRGKALPVTIAKRPFYKRDR